MYGIEEQIRQAMADGKFANLPGKGQPVNLDENPFADPDWCLAYHVLSSSGFTLPWIESRQDLLAETQTVRVNLSRAWDWVTAAQAAGGTPSIIQESWLQAQEKFCQQAAGLNRRIFSYNLQAPTHYLQILLLDVEAELQAVQKPTLSSRGAED